MYIVLIVNKYRSWNPTARCRDKITEGLKQIHTGAINVNSNRSLKIPIKEFLQPI